MAQSLLQGHSEDDATLSLGASSPGLSMNQNETKKKAWWHFLCCCLPGASRKKPEAEAIATKPAPQAQLALHHQAPPPVAPAPAAPPVTQAPVEVLDSPMHVAPPARKYLLGPLPAEMKNRKTLVLDLDETLVHSSFKPIPNADFVISIELDSVTHRVYVRKRPGVDEFMRVVGEIFEVVVFTASLSKYADPLLDILDKHKVVHTRLFREACVLHYGNYVKDLSHLGREMSHTVIIDNSPYSYMFQPQNAIPIISWFHDKSDRQLYELLPFLQSLQHVNDVLVPLERKRMSIFNSAAHIPPPSPLSVSTIHHASAAAAAQTQSSSSSSDPLASVVTQVACLDAE